MRLVGLGLLLVLATVASACDRDPYRIGVELQTSEHLTIRFAPCGESVAVKRVAISRSGLNRAPIWEIKAENAGGERRYEFPVGEAPEGFRLTVPLISDVGSGAFVIIDSTFREGQSYSFEPGELRQGLVLAGNGRYFTPEEFRDGALCGNGRWSGGLIGLVRDHPWPVLVVAAALLIAGAVFALARVWLRPSRLEATGGRGTS